MQNNRINYLKALAILMIVLTHNGFEPQERLELWFPYLVDLAVPIFMLVSGYTYSLSMRHRDLSIKDWFQWAHIKDKLMRFLPTYLIVISIQFITKLMVDGPMPLPEMVQMFLTGGWGPGGYYVTFMVSLVFIFPFLYWLVRHWQVGGVILIMAFNLLWEALGASGIIEYDLFRILIPRVFAFIAMGIWLEVHKKTKPGWMALGFAASAIFIYLLRYEYVPRDLFQTWPATPLPVIGIPFVLVAWASRGPLTKKSSILDKIGRASWHIYLTQMLYFFFLSPDFWELRFKLDLPGQVLVSIILCFSIGLIWYQLENSWKAY